MEPSDSDLLRRIGQGDRDALAPLMERHYRRLYRIVLAYLRDPDEALDAVQETFVKAYCHAERGEGAMDVGAWLTRVAIHEAIDRYRRRKRRSASFAVLGREVVHDHAPDPERALAGREIAVQVNDAIQALPPGQRAIFVLRHHENLRLDEIATVLGLRLGSVKSGLHRAVRHLRERLGEVRR